MNSTPRHQTAQVLSRLPSNPEKSLAASRLEIVQALREALGVLLLKRMLTALGSSSAPPHHLDPEVQAVEMLKTNKALSTPLP